MRVKKRHISLLITLKVAALVLLSVTGMNFSLAGSLSSNSDSGVYQHATIDDTPEVLSVDSNLGDDRQWPRLPEESSSKEEEEIVDDDKTEERSTESSFTESAGFSLSGYTLPASKESSYYLCFVSYWLSVPLYILFHSWKNFLI